MRLQVRYSVDRLGPPPPSTVSRWSLRSTDGARREERKGSTPGEEADLAETLTGSKSAVTFWVSRRFPYWQILKEV